jgi:hypothetical protein
MIGGMTVSAARALVCASFAVGMILTGAGAPVLALSSPPVVQGVQIPVGLLRFYCIEGADAFSVGMVTCLAKNRLGECKWSGKNYPALPPDRAYWQNSVAPGGECP